MSDHLDDEQLSRLIDGDLSLTTREAVMTHLRSCAGCAVRHDRLVDVAATLRMEPAVEWTPIDVEAVTGRLAHRRHPVRPAAALVAAVVMCALVLVEVGPLVAMMLTLAGVVLAVGQALPPTPVGGSGAQAIGLVVVIAIVAPLAAYPLARWR